MKKPEIIVPESTRYQKAILNGLQDKPVYQGTANPRKVAKRRAANKVARASRRGNR